MFKLIDLHRILIDYFEYLKIYDAVVSFRDLSNSLVELN